MYTKLVKNYENIVNGKDTLFCFPFAGGGASAYNQWIKKMQSELTVCPIQLPGREDRIRERPYENFSELLDDLEKAIFSVLKGSFALWGHSMGGKIAYELEKRMEKRGCIAKCFLVSGCKAPHLQEPNPISHLSDDEFKKELKRFEGMPKEILDNQELIDYFLPMLRADFKMNELYNDNTATTLMCPIVAFAGKDDKEANAEEMKAWRVYTENNFDYEIFSGGHFYIRDQQEKVIQTVKDQLRRFSRENT